eukprot:119646-Chlamydomonas_euryale.AAC.1
MPKDESTSMQNSAICSERPALAHLWVRPHPWARPHLCARPHIWVRPHLCAIGMPPCLCVLGLPPHLCKLGLPPHLCARDCDVETPHIRHKANCARSAAAAAVARPSRAHAA